jgi:hypothetical protein
MPDRLHSVEVSRTCWLTSAYYLPKKPQPFGLPLHNHVENRHACVHSGGQVNRGSSCSYNELRQSTSDFSQDGASVMAIVCGHGTDPRMLAKDPTTFSVSEIGDRLVINECFGQSAPNISYILHHYDYGRVYACKSKWHWRRWKPVAIDPVAPWDDGFALHITDVEPLIQEFVGG